MKRNFGERLQSTHVQHFPISIVNAGYGLHSEHCAAYLWEISHVLTTWIFPRPNVTLSTPIAVYKDLFLVPEIFIRRESQPCYHKV